MIDINRDIIKSIPNKTCELKPFWVIYYKGFNWYYYGSYATFEEAYYCSVYVDGQVVEIHD